MGLNVIIIIVGIVVVITGLVLFIKVQERENENNETDFFSLQEKSIKDETPIEIAMLRQEIIQLQSQVDEFSVLLQQTAPAKEEVIESAATDEKFEHLLNYTRFAQKNSKVIQLFHEGKSAEEIARVLGKSIREVEMVIKLIK